MRVNDPEIFLLMTAILKILKYQCYFKGLRKFSKVPFEVCVAVGEPSIEQILYDKLRQNIKIATIIHPEVQFQITTIGEGTIICKFVSCLCDMYRQKCLYPYGLYWPDSVIGMAPLFLVS